MHRVCRAALAFSSLAVTARGTLPAFLRGLFGGKPLFFVIAAMTVIFYCVLMKQRVVFFLYPGVVSLDVSGPLEVFASATEILARDNRDDQGYTPVFAACTPGPVRTSSGLMLTAETTLESVSPDILVVPGATDAETTAKNPQVVQQVRGAAARAGRIAGVCSGAFILAACGLLHGKKAATHWLVADRLASMYPQTAVDPEAIFVRDGRVSTSGGVTAGIDLALDMVEEDYGGRLPMEVARVLLLYRRRPGNQSQYSSALAAQVNAGRFASLVRWMEANLGGNLSVECLAEMTHMSPRSFARTFPAETGSSPARFVEGLRLTRARELIEAGADSFASVAQQAGFGSEERLRKAFVRRLGMSPHQYRRHFFTGKQE